MSNYVPPGIFVPSPRSLMFAHFRALVFGCEFFWPAALCPLAAKLARLLMETRRLFNCETGLCVLHTAPDGYIFELLIMDTPKGQWSPFDANFMDWNLIGPGPVEWPTQNAEKRWKICRWQIKWHVQIVLRLTSWLKPTRICNWCRFNVHLFSARFDFVPSGERMEGWKVRGRFVNAAIAAAVLLVRAINCWLHSLAVARGVGVVSDAEIA